MVRGKGFAAVFSRRCPPPLPNLIPGPPVAPSPQGPWADGAVTVLRQLSDWFAINGEAILGTEPVYPSAGNGAFLTSRNKTVYVIVPRTAPDSDGGGAAAPPASQLYQALQGAAQHPFVRQDESTLTLPWFRANLMRDKLFNVSLLGKGPLGFATQRDGLAIKYPSSASHALLRTYTSTNRSVELGARARARARARAGGEGKWGTMGERDRKWLTGTLPFATPQDTHGPFSILLGHGPLRNARLGHLPNVPGRRLHLFGQRSAVLFRREC